MSSPQMPVQLFYYLSEQSDGLWEIRETSAGQLVSLNGQACCALKKRDAEDLLDYLINSEASLAA